MHFQTCVARWGIVTWAVYTTTVHPLPLEAPFAAHGANVTQHKTLSKTARLHRMSFLGGG
jgi:hypothetical protein